MGLILTNLLRMMSCSKCTGCSVVGYITLAVYAIVTLITLYAAYNTHFLPNGGGFIAGAPEGSLALLTLIFSFHMLVKTFMKCCPCKTDGACSSSGGCCK